MGRVTATVLFTDLVGSTELRARLGEEAADGLRRRHDRLLAEMVGGRGGRVVKGLGDGILATFAGASDAVTAAVAIQQAVDRMNRTGQTSVPLAVRVGLSAGDVAFEDDDVHGRPVIEAARLCAAAAGGEILTSELVRGLACADDTHRFISVGAVVLKGVADRLATVRVEWEPALSGPVPMPALLADVGAIFVGREGELERLTQLWKEAAAGERRLVLLAGEPGVGKTRLAAELARRVHDEGAVVLGGRCDEDLGVPYQPFVEGLRHFVDHTPTPELEGRLGRYGGELVRLVPELAERVPRFSPAFRSDPETERYRLFDAVAGWLEATSSDQPVSLVVDDLHWAAKPTLLLLRHVLRAPVPLRLLIVATYRDTELGRRHPLTELLADLRRQAGVERRALGGLDAPAVARLVEEVAGDGLEGDVEGLAQALHTQTEGNPFFIAEVLRHLAETGALEWHGGGSVTTGAIEDVGIPEGIRDVVGRRLSRLSDEANQVLAVAAVVGAEFEPGVVRQAAGLSDGEVAGAFEEAAAARLITEPATSASKQYRFAHALVRATLYDELSAARRVVLHRKVAEAIESVHGSRLRDHLPALAYHYAESTLPGVEPTKAVNYARRAGDAALAQLAHDDAVRYYRQGLKILGASEAPVDDRQRIELLIALGEAERRAGSPTYRETLFEAARRARHHGDSDALARAALANCRGSLVSAIGRDDPDRIELLQAALEATGDVDSPIRARLMAHAALEQTWTSPRHHVTRLSDAAVDMSRRLGDPATLADVLLSSFYAIHDPSTAAKRSAYADELVGLAEHLGDERLAVHAYWHRTRVAMETGDLAQAIRGTEHQARLSAGLGEPTLRWMAAISAAGPPVAAGRLREAEDRNSTALAIGRDVQPDARTFWAAYLFPVRYAQGRLDEMLPLVLEYADDPNFRVVLPRALVALSYSELGRQEESRRYYAPLAANRFRDARFDNVWLVTLAACGQVAVALGDSTSAAHLSRLMAPYWDQVAVMSSAGLNFVGHYLGVLAAGLGRYDEADARFHTAAAAQVRIGAPGWLAHTRLEWARMLLSRRDPGDVDRAQGLLGEALGSARQLGMAKVERDADSLLQ